MFVADGIFLRSTLLDVPGVRHGFSTRAGGVSTHPYTASMNLAMGREDPDGVVRENAEIFVRAVTAGALGMPDVVAASQYHTTLVRTVGTENRGETMTCPGGEPCDGFVTDAPGVFPLVRVADCTPLLLLGFREDASPVVAAVHAGWRGSCAGIAAVAVWKMRALGARPASIRAAIGPHIHPCCLEVGEDMRETVTQTAGADFAAAYCRPRTAAGKYSADMAGMNRFYLLSAGVRTENIDISPDCTACGEAEMFHSHRRTAGKRGAMGAGIAILPTA